MSQNGLRLNHEKTEWIIFNGNTHRIKDVELHIGTQTIQQSKVIRNLGVKLDSELTLQSQISDVHMPNIILSPASHQQDSKVPD